MELISVRCIEILSFDTSSLLQSGKMEAKVPLFIQNGPQSCITLNYDKESSKK